MKFDKESTPNGVHIPAAALKISRIPFGEKVDLYTLDNTMILLKGRMTAMELLTVVEQLQKMETLLLTHLSKVCGSCEDCGGDSCPAYDGLKEKPISLPDDLYKEAGIPMDVKLCATVDSDEHTVKLSVADYDYDLRDVPEQTLEMFAATGVCLGELDERLILGDIVYGL